MRHLLLKFGIIFFLCHMLSPFFNNISFKFDIILISDSFFIAFWNFKYNYSCILTFIFKNLQNSLISNDKILHSGNQTQESLNFLYQQWNGHAFQKSVALILSIDLKAHILPFKGEVIAFGRKVKKKKSHILDIELQKTQIFPVSGCLLLK